MKANNHSLSIACAGLALLACSSPPPPDNVDAGATDATATDATATDATATDAPWQSLNLCPAPHTLGYHLATSTDPTSFSYDPAGLLLTDITGTYQPDTGNFAWTATYHPDNPRTATQVQGIVTGMDDQYTVAFTRSTTFFDGRVEAEEVEETWQGCAVERRTRSTEPGAAWWQHSGLFDGTVHAYTDTKPSAYTGGIREFTGTIEADLSWREVYSDFDNLPEREEIHEGDADGWLRRSYTIDYGDGSTEFLDEWQLNGNHRYRREFDSDGDGCETSEWHDITVDINGAGTGQATYCDYTIDPVYGTRYVCDVTIMPGSCVQVCPGGPTVTCTWE